jgi:Golgi nucleoside diphosphatase
MKIYILFSSSKSNSSFVQINDADCLPRGFRTNYTKLNQTVSVIGEGDFANCTKHLVTLLNLNAACLRKPCSFNGVYQPEINYHSQDFYGFSEFWYTMQGLKSSKSSFSIRFFCRYFKTRWTL